MHSVQTDSCPLWVVQRVWDSTQRGRFGLQRASCHCKCWSCFGKPSGDSCWQIDSFLGLISTFFLSLCAHMLQWFWKDLLKKSHLPLPQWKDTGVGKQQHLTMYSDAIKFNITNYSNYHAVKSASFCLTLLRGFVLAFVVFHRCVHYCSYFYTLISTGYCCDCGRMAASMCMCGAYVW